MEHTTLKLYKNLSEKFETYTVYELILNGVETTFPQP